jgi:hypothetical protein
MKKTPLDVELKREMYAQSFTSSWKLEEIVGTIQKWGREKFHQLVYDLKMKEKLSSNFDSTLLSISAKYKLRR